MAGDVTLSRPVPIWAGRTLAFVGVILVAASVREAVSAISPILSIIEGDIPFTPVAVGLLGMLAPFSFALFGLAAPWVARRIGLEWALITAGLLVALGQVLRALAGDTNAFLGWSIVALAGIGASNVLLPPIIKKYFPDQIQFMSAMYVTIMVAATMFPPLVTAPIANLTNWRFSIASWAIIAVMAVIPWMALIIRRRSVDKPVEPPHNPKITRLVWASPLSWAITLGFSTAAFNAYTMLAWLPVMLQERVGMTPSETGAMLAFYALLGLPAGLFGPYLVARLKNVSFLFYLSGATLLAGYLGLLLWPGTGTILWVGLAGLGPLLFPVCLVLINFRTRTQAGSVALSGMAQGLGYALGALGPLIVGLLHATTPSWTPMLLMLMGSGVVAILAGVVMRKNVMVDGTQVGSPAPPIPE
jgi:CP family cyanate transporter-like MFS transporter